MSLRKKSLIFAESTIDDDAEEEYEQVDEEDKRLSKLDESNDAESKSVSYDDEHDEGDGAVPRCMCCIW